MGRCGKENPSISPGGRSRESNKVYIYIFGGEYQKMATGEMHLSAVLQNGSARVVRRVIGEMQVLGDFPSIQRNEMGN